jgi:hypothetical protein
MEAFQQIRMYVRSPSKFYELINDGTRKWNRDQPETEYQVRLLSGDAYRTSMRHEPEQGNAALSPVWTKPINITVSRNRRAFICRLLYEKAVEGCLLLARFLSKCVPDCTTTDLDFLFQQLYRPR